MSDELKFDMKAVEEKPSRTYAKGSKYDPIIDSFVEGKHPLVEVSVDGKEPNYLRTQLAKRITARELSISVSVANSQVYLEKSD